MTDTYLERLRRRDQRRARLRSLVAVLGLILGVALIADSLVSQVKSYQAWRTDRDKLIYLCGWLHRGYRALDPGWPGTEMRGFTTTDAPLECREFRTLTLPRRPA